MPDDEREPPAPKEISEPDGEPAAPPEVSPAEIARRQELEERFEALFRRHHKRAVACIAQMGFLREEARQLAQDAFIRVYHSMEQEKFRGGLQEEWAFVWTTARNVALNAIRHAKTK